MESEPKKSRELTATDLYIALLCSSPVLGLFIYLDRTDQGFGAWSCVALILLAIKNRWELRKHVWFWIAIALIVFIQIPIVLWIPWGEKGITGRGVYPVAILDGALAYGCLKLAETMVRRVSLTNSAT